MLTITDKLRLRPFAYPEDCDIALPWYWDAEVLYYSEGLTEGKYNLDTVKRMYSYLLGIGEVYIIEIEEEGKSIPVGDATFSQEDLPIVIGTKKHRSMGIGRHVIGCFIDRAIQKGWSKLNVRQIFEYNVRSRRLFEGLGFRPVASGTDRNGNNYTSYKRELPGGSNIHLS